MIVFLAVTYLSSTQENIFWNTFVVLKVLGFYGSACYIQQWTDQQFSQGLLLIFWLSFTVFVLEFFVIGPISFKGIASIEFPRIDGPAGHGLHSAVILGVFSLTSYFIGLRGLSVCFAGLSITGLSYTAMICLGIAFSLALLRCKKITRICMYTVCFIFLTQPFTTLLYGYIPSSYQYMLSELTNLRILYQYIYAKESVHFVFGAGTNNDLAILDGAQDKEYVKKLYAEYSKEIEHHFHKEYLYSFNTKKHDVNFNKLFFTDLKTPHSAPIQILVAYGIVGYGIFCALNIGIVCSLNGNHVGQVFITYSLLYHLMNDFHFFIFFYALGAALAFGKFNSVSHIDICGQPNEKRGRCCD